MMVCALVRSMGGGLEPATWNGLVIVGAETALRFAFGKTVALGFTEPPSGRHTIGVADWIAACERQVAA